MVIFYRFLMFFVCLPGRVQCFLASRVHLRGGVDHIVGAHDQHDVEILHVGVHLSDGRDFFMVIQCEARFLMIIYSFMVI